MKLFQKVRTAVVGCGKISGIYFENMLHEFSILEVVGCCDVNEALTEQTAAAHGIKALTMEEILHDDTIELVVNLTPPGAHYQVIKTLLENGKHVYTEKVLCPDIGQAGAGERTSPVQCSGYIPGRRGSDCAVSCGIRRDRDRDLLRGCSAERCRASGGEVSLYGKGGRRHRN